MTTIQRGLLGTIITVAENARAIVLRHGRFHDILVPGRHRIGGWPSELMVETHLLTRPEFVSDYAHALLREKPELAAQHITVLKTSGTEVAVIERDGKLYGVLKPDGQTLFWTDAGPWAFTRHDITGPLDLAPALAQRLGTNERVKRFNVLEGQKGLLAIDNAFVRVLEAGAHAFWNTGRPVDVKIIDIRQHALEVAGQEILTRDQVTIRVNLAAEYRVADPVKAAGTVKDFEAALYRALQFAFRKTLGVKTLDQILANKVTVDEEAASGVRREMAAIGLDVGEIAIKDVVLPGEVKDILNKVVAAEKEAQANSIRRREETNATRSLLNTAKVMEENPIMLRLKELEALEKIAGQVQSLTVHSGTKGLLEDIVSLRPAVPVVARRK